jgi:DNA-binding winged helix-turn-helix (wHTH) protein
VQFTFDNYTLDTERRELRRGGAAIAMQPQVFDLLVYLMQNREHVVSKDDLIAFVWQGAAAALKELRRAQPNISLAWIASQLPWKFDSDREHYLEAFRRAGLD